MNPQRLRTFSLIAIDRMYRQKAPFLRSLLWACINTHERIMNNRNLYLAKNIPLFCDNMVNQPELEEQILSKRNRALISVVSLSLLCYARNERFNLFQRVIGYYAFSSNIAKRSIESLHQMHIIVSYESIWRGLQVNAQAVIKEILDKTRFHRFFILYDNINFYEYVRDQQLQNRSVMVNYTAGYICFIKILGKGKEDDTCLDRYIDLTQIDQRLVNIIVNEDFDFIQTNHDH